MLVKSITELVGNTPVLRLPREQHDLQAIDVYLKLEYLSIFGSTKDRVAWALLEPLLERAKKDKKTIVEASSGNTGKALAALCGIYGLDFKSYTNRIKVSEQRMILQLLDADLEELPGLSDCPDPHDPNDPTRLCSDLITAHPDKYEYTDQYFNEDNIRAHYETTGKELFEDIGSVDYLIGPLGTCGSTLGAGRYLRERNSDTKIIGAVSSPGQWVPGARNANELWEVGHFQNQHYDAVESCSLAQAVEAMLFLNRKAGVLCGPSAGMSYHVGMEYLRKLDAELAPREERLSAVFIMCDGLQPYLSYIKKIKPELFLKSTTSRRTVSNLSEDELRSTPSIDVPGLQEKLSQDPLIVDVRAAFAYSMGHIAGAVNIRDELLAVMLEEGKPFPDMKRPIVVVCGMGDISVKFACFLAQQGYRASNLSGGIQSWKQAGLPLERLM